MAAPILIKNADSGERRVIGGSYGCGGRASDIGQRSGGYHAQIPAEQFGQKEHKDNMQYQHEETVHYPHGCGDQIGQACSGCQQGDDRIQVQVGYVLHCRKLAQGG